MLNMTAVPESSEQEGTLATCTSQGGATGLQREHPELLAGTHKDP